jgi:hypothetical protein
MARTIPIWLKLHMSLWFIGLMVFNLLLDSGVMIGLLSIYKVSMKKDVRVRTVFMAWIFGIISDFLIIMTLLVIANGMTNYDISNPYKSISGIIFMSIMMIMSVVLVFFMIKYLMKKVAVFGGKETKIAIWMAVITAPYYILLPINITFESLL